MAATKFGRGGRNGPRFATDSVGNRPLATLTVAPTTASAAQSATTQYTVTGVDTFGNSCPIPAADIGWTVSDVDAGTVSAAGLVTRGTVNGTYQVRATHTRSAVYDESDVVVTA